MATLINMENTPQEAKAQVGLTPESDAPKYPWGLEISLNDDSLDKLGIETLPAVGTAVTIVAKATVSSTSERATESDGACASMCLQITEMQLSGVQEDALGRATKALYGGTNAS